MEKLILYGRKFDGFARAITRQKAAFPGGESIEEQWFEVDALENELLHRKAAARGECDITMSVTDWLPELIAGEQLLPLNDFLEKDPPQDWPGGWSPSMRGLQTAPNGRVYGIPYHDGPMMFLYRKDLFESAEEQAGFKERFGYALRPARTWAEFVDIAKHFDRPKLGLRGTVFAGMPDGHNNVYDFLLQLWSRGGQVIGADGRPAFDSDAGRAALAFLKSVWHEHKFVDPEARGWDSIQSGVAFAAGHAAMMVNWCGFAALSADPASPTNGKVGCGPVPMWEGPGGRSVSLNIYYVMAIARGCRNPAAAWEFIKHLATPAMDKLTSTEGGNGVRLSTWRDAEVRALSPYYEIIEAIHESVESPPSIPQYPAINMIISDMVEDVMSLRQEPDAALAAAQIKAAALFA